VDVNLEEEYRLIFVVSYLQMLHLVPRKKIFLEHTLHVDNFSRLPHLRIIQRRRKENQLVCFFLLLSWRLCKSKNDDTTTDHQHRHPQRINLVQETNNSETNTNENRQRIERRGASESSETSTANSEQIRTCVESYARFDVEESANKYCESEYLITNEREREREVVLRLRKSSEQLGSPGVRGSFSASLLCAEPIGDPDMVGERIVGDLGVAAPEDRDQIEVDE
jgi:hypothetical protein